MPNIFIVTALLAVCVAHVLLVYVIRKHTVKESFYLIFLSIYVFLFIVGNLLEISAQNLEAAFFGVRVQYIGAPYIALLNYLFFRDIYGKERLSFKKHVLLFALPSIMVLLLQAFPYTRLYYDEIWYTYNGLFATLQHTSGIMYHIGAVFNYAFVLLSFCLVLTNLRQDRAHLKRRSLLLLGGWVIPIIANLINMILPNKVYELIPFTYLPTLFIYFYSALSDELLNIMPFARAQVIEELEDAFIVCSEDYHFIDANLSAKRLFPKLSTMRTGSKFERLPDYIEKGELVLQRNDETNVYKVTSTPIFKGTKNSGLCIVFRNITTESRLLEHLKQQAEIDGLTGLYNRKTFFDIAREILHQGRIRVIEYALLLIDLDHFKDINDTYGHLCGDAVLKVVADTINQQFRSGDIVGRYGGEEFVVLLENLSEVQAAAVAEKLRKKIENLEIPYQDQIIRITVSVGIAHQSAEKTETLEGLIQKADEALYASKDEGRNRSSLY